MVMFSITLSAQEIKTHIVQRGETIQSIAEKYQVSVEAIKNANPHSGGLVYVGLKLKIPSAMDNTLSVPVRSTSDSLPSKNTVYRQDVETNSGKNNSSYHSNEKEIKLAGDMSTMQNSGFMWSLLVDAYGGYSTFKWSGGTPKAGIGFGGGISGQFFLSGNNSPDGYFAEIGIGYSRKGSAAYPMDYVGAKVFPLSYSFGENSFFVKIGGYLGYPLSKIKTINNSYDGKLDYGVDVGVGVFFLEKFSAMISIEEGFAKICDSSTKLNNRNVFLTLSYRIK